VSVSAASSWWQHAVVYQIYPRSFADGDGDGIGDLAGARARLPYLAALGVDAVWFSPWYPSPWADGGYDVADYRNIDPLYGSLREAGAFIAGAHEHGIKVLLDLVPNHCSVSHRLFLAALAAGPGSRERELFHFRDGLGEDGAQPPNNWPSCFGGPAWTRVTEPDGTPGQWYLHMFAPGQPDWNWEHPAVHAEFESTLRFWFDRGVDGFRIDVADYLYKAPGLPDHDTDTRPAAPQPWKDRPETIGVYRSWRRIADSYPERKVLIGELWKNDPKEFAAYIGPDRLDAGFNFSLLTAPPEAAKVRESIMYAIGAHAATGYPSPWVLSNHDVVRPATRYGTPIGGTSAGLAWTLPAPGSVDPETGLRRARAMALLALALPGNACIYQGEELGLPEVLDLPDDVLRDPRFEQSGRADRGRDGCRVPLPWDGTQPPFGFSPAGAVAEPWLPQPDDWKNLTAEAQDGDPASTLSLYRTALHLRRVTGPLTDPEITWLPCAGGMLAFLRGEHVLVVVNLTDREQPLPGHYHVLLTSASLGTRTIPPYCAAWLVV
jgi:alpha-glucosidase